MAYTISLLCCLTLALGKPIDLRDLSLKNMAQELLHKQAPQIRALQKPAAQGESLQAPIYNPKDFDENCIACIFRGFSFCLDFRTCLRADQTCPRGIKVNNQTGCPIAGECPDFGYEGVGYLGEGAQYNMGGLALDGKLYLKVPSNYPCYISLVNSRRNKVDFTLYGLAQNTSAFMMQINYPFNASNYTLVEFGKTYRIHKTDDITILYLGSLIDENTTSLIEWKKIPEPLSAFRALANLAVLASALFIGYMI